MHHQFVDHRLGLRVCISGARLTMDPITLVALASSTIGIIALANDVVQMGREMCKMNETRKDTPIRTMDHTVSDKSTFIRKVNRPESVMDACTHCHCRRWTL